MSLNQSIPPSKTKIIRRASDRPVAVRIPANNVPNTRYAGYLMVEKSFNLLTPKIKKTNSLSRKNDLDKNFTRYWCVLAECCLYCYNSEVSEVTDHCLMLRGYIVKESSLKNSGGDWRFWLSHGVSKKRYFKPPKRLNFLIEASKYFVNMHI